MKEMLPVPLDNAHALVIGIANYQHITPLPPTVLKDASDMHALLIAPQHCAYPPDHVQLLLDDQATTQAITAALADLASRTNPDSTALIYISSHGGHVPTGPLAGEYLLPVDTVLPYKPEFAQRAISGRAFTDALRAIPARKLLVIFDCCHAAGIGQPKDAEAASTYKTGLPDSYYDQLKSGVGRVIIASSRSDELSWVLPGATNSLFTQHLLAGLQGGIPSDDGFIRIFDLFEYLQPRVTRDQQNQHPVFKAEVEENFAVGLYQGGQKGIIARDDQGFRYDAYISFVDEDPDAAWVWDTLVPRLEAEGLRVAVSGYSDDPGVPMVVSADRGITLARRTLAVLSDRYTQSTLGEFQNTLAQHVGVEGGTYRLIPLQFEALDLSAVPARIRQIKPLDLSGGPRSEREFKRLTQALKQPLPPMGR